MKRLLTVVVAAAMVAAALIRRRSPSYSSWAEYRMADIEGDALLPADPYLAELES